MFRTCDIEVAAVDSVTVTVVMKTLEKKVEIVVGSCAVGCSGSSSYNSGLVATAVALISRCW